MDKFKIDFAYNGKNFSGFQVQPEKRTVQGEIEAALFVLLKKKTKIYASGRTDAGVSALHQVAHFEAEEGIIAPKRLLDGLNALLPQDISVIKIEYADKDFDARFSAKRKTYSYYFYISKYTHALFDEFAVRLNDYADVNKMNEACKRFIGTHDFASFVSRKSGKTDFIRTIFDAKIVALGEGLYAFKITGDGFLYNMVRIIFGTLVQVGYNKILSEDVTKIIEQRLRASAGKTMPAKALCLERVEYK